MNRAAFPRVLFQSRRKLFWLFAGVALLLDQLTKAWLWRLPPSPDRPLVLIPNVLNLISHPGNTKGAFGLGPQPPLFYVVAGLVGVALTIVFLLTTPAGNGLVSSALGLLAGGAVGNLIDRASRSHVRDFLDLHWRDAYHWPTFNVADTAICIGFAVIVIDVLWPRGRGEPVPQDADIERQEAKKGPAEGRSA